MARKRIDSTTIPVEKRAYLIDLHGIKDSECFLVNEETWQYINNATAPIPERRIADYVNDSHPGEVWTREKAIRYLSRWEGSSPDNDRAIGIGSDFDIEDAFDTDLHDLIAVAQEKGLTIVDTFIGHIY